MHQSFLVPELSGVSGRQFHSSTNAGQVSLWCILCFSANIDGCFSASSYFWHQKDDFIPALMMVGFPSMRLNFGANLELVFRRPFLICDIRKTISFPHQWPSSFSSMHLNLGFLVSKSSECFSSLSLFLTSERQFQSSTNWWLGFLLMHLIFGATIERMFLRL